MDCANCELTRLKFYCENCLKNHLVQFQSVLKTVSDERDDHIANAKNALATMNPARKIRASRSSLVERIRDIQTELKRLRESNDKTQARLKSLRLNLSTRRASLSQARQLPVMQGYDRETARTTIDTLHRTALDSALSLARARAGLVQELVEVFDIVEVGGRPSLGARLGVKGEWNIVGNVLPVPGDIRRYPVEQINATVQHTLHFINLLTYYLGIKLPFEVSWSGGLPGIGQPFISASKGAENGGWSKWVDPYPLHLDPAAQSTTAASPSSHNQSAAGGSSEKDRDKDKVQDKETQAQSFTTGFAMLLYNVAYLAHTQGVEVALSKSGEVLRNLWAVCCSLELGKKSHATPVPSLSLPPPTPPSFALDFTQLLQATTAKPPSRVGGAKGRKPAVKETIPEEDGEWDLI